MDKNDLVEKAATVEEEGKCMQFFVLNGEAVRGAGLLDQSAGLEGASGQTDAMQRALPQK
jgi:hypothetical protein